MVTTATRTSSRMWPSSPFRSPNWRWQLANAIVTGDPSAEAVGSPDPAVMSAVSVLRSSGGLAVVEGCGASVVRKAAAIWQSNVLGRCLVESRLLAGSTVSQVATQIDQPIAVVSAFHDVFFDVATRRQHASYIVRFAIDVPVRWDVSVPLDVALRAFAYFGGPYVLDQVITAFANDLRGCGVQDRAITAPLKRSRAKRVRDAVRVWMTPVTEDNAANWLSIYVDQVAAELFGPSRLTRRNVVAALRRRPYPIASTSGEQKKLVTET